MGLTTFLMGALLFDQSEATDAHLASSHYKLTCMFNLKNFI